MGEKEVSHNHSPTPWDCSVDRGHILDAKGNFVAITGMADFDVTTKDAANAECIVACVNALGHFDWSNEDLKDRAFVKGRELSEDGKVIGILFNVDRVVRKPYVWPEDTNHAP